ncbi:MAG: hypothetical protein QNJ38_13125 [Prochloraceae cyanobacterium]|nr:hypothetical protein [Prochloraceae cyanobacterium]
MVFIINANNSDLEYCALVFKIKNSQEIISGLVYLDRLFMLAESYSKNELKKATKLYKKYLQVETNLTAIIVESSENVGLWIHDERLEKIKPSGNKKNSELFENKISAADTIVENQQNRQYGSIESSKPLKKTVFISKQAIQERKKKLTYRGISIAGLKPIF